MPLFEDLYTAERCELLPPMETYNFKDTSLILHSPGKLVIPLWERQLG